MPRSTAMVRALARSSAVAACLVGLLVLTGWALDVMVLKSMGAALPAMRPSAALGLLLGGAALGLRLRATPSRFQHRLGTALALTTALLGAASLVDGVITGGTGGLDALFLRMLGDAGGAAPGVASSPLTALCLMLLGPALALVDRGHPQRLSWSDGLVVLALMAALTGLNGFLLGPLVTPFAAPFFQERSMGLHTTCVLMLLAMGTLCARPELGLMARLTRDTLGGFVARRLVPVTLLGPPVLGLTLVLLHLTGGLSHDAKLPLFATVVAAGGVTLVLLAARALDVLDTERMRATAALEASEERFRTFLDTAPDPMVVVDATGRVRFANAEAERVFGYRREALLAREVELLVPEGLHGPAAPGEGPERARGGRLVSGQRQDGTSVPLEVRLSPLPLEGEDDATRIAILRDVTERRDLEKLREEYVGLISHDLRNPLNTINLRAHLLQRALHERKLEREGHMAQAIIHNVEWMSTMIEELLEGSRLESGRVNLRREARDLGRFLEEVLERDVPPDARERFRLHRQEPLPPVPMDAARMERVVTNLLTNALKYSPTGTPVDVRLSAVHDHAVVSVTNQGAGLSPRDAARLFDKYYRTEDGRSADGKGLGLGLYISRLIVEAHGGHIWVESEPGRGVTFFFSVPMESPAVPTVPEPLRQRAG
ncbi:cell wall metabolism sensor histidine kinase WalK [Corallococcus sp. AS-1-6]|uniref:sensor histidine kinase n=1 Tax=Corallococcus sp. AS-1-6 TaxID=2874599 RepID=UPI001CBD89EA|nr:ATP-binding protein [Corallococcus sp. AS-1-6]MBZ4374495.1 PAS domain S-box protein [Corallococcus sp. AS-1-6]